MMGDGSWVMFRDKVLLIDDKSSLSHYPDDPDDPHASLPLTFPLPRNHPDQTKKVRSSRVA